MFLPRAIVQRLLKAPRNDNKKGGADGPMVLLRWLLWLACEHARTGLRTVLASPARVAADFAAKDGRARQERHAVRKDGTIALIRPRAGMGESTLQNYRADFLDQCALAVGDGRYRLRRSKQFDAIPLTVAEQLLYHAAPFELRAALGAMPSLSAANDRRADDRADGRAGKSTVTARARRCAKRNGQGVTTFCRAMRGLRVLQLIEDNRPGASLYNGRRDRHPVREIDLGRSLLVPLRRDQIVISLPPAPKATDSLSDPLCEVRSDPNSYAEDNQPAEAGCAERTSATAEPSPTPGCDQISASDPGLRARRSPGFRPSMQQAAAMPDHTPLTGRAGSALVRLILAIAGFVGWREASERAAQRIAHAVGHAGVLRRILDRHGARVRDYADSPITYLAEVLAKEGDACRDPRWIGPRCGASDRHDRHEHERAGFFVSDPDADEKRAYTEARARTLGDLPAMEAEARLLRAAGMDKAAEWLDANARVAREAAAYTTTRDLDPEIVRALELAIPDPGERLNWRSLRLRWRGVGDATIVTLDSSSADIFAQRWPDPATPYMRRVGLRAGESHLAALARALAETTKIRWELTIESPLRDVRHHATGG